MNPLLCVHTAGQYEHMFSCRLSHVCTANSQQCPGPKAGCLVCRADAVPCCRCRTVMRRQPRTGDATGAATATAGRRAAVAADIVDNSKGCPAACAGQCGSDEDVTAAASLLLQLKQQPTSAPAAATAAVMAVSAAAAGEEGRGRAPNGIAPEAVCNDSGLVGSPGNRTVQRSPARRSSEARDTLPNSTYAANRASPQCSPPAAAGGGQQCEAQQQQQQQATRE